jgi:hypothetical protein
MSAEPSYDSGQTTLMAVNVLLLPDRAARARVVALNALLRADLPAGFAFDETHVPHITLLQRYVPAGDLDGLIAAVGGALARTGIPRELTAARLSCGELGTPEGTSVVSVDVEPAAALRAVHDGLLAAARPFAQAGGTEESFFRLPGEPPPNAATVAYVEEFVPVHSDGRYSPHMTVGVGAAESIDRLTARPFDHFVFATQAVALYRLGDLGTARREIRTWVTGSSQSQP